PMPPPTPIYFQQAMSSATEDPAAASTFPAPKPKRTPLLRLELRDLSQPGTHSFFKHLSASNAIEDAVSGVLYWLYKDLPTHCIPSTRSVTLILRPMGGVAYTTGKDFDDDHKEIHFSTDYINGIAEGRKKEEMLGVIRHEMVHCWQWNAQGSAPGGLIEGIADWVRLKSGFVPPHWKQESDGDWDAGYQHTGYFLEYLEKTFGEGSVRKINDGLRGQKYKDGELWENLFGKKVEKLWEDYGRHLRNEKADEEAKRAKEEGEKKDEATSDSKSSEQTPEKITRSGGNIHYPRRGLGP
ncbi:BSP-domain-containing protein, partial [Lophium mytilinum]